MQKYVIIVEKTPKKFANDKNYRKLKDHCHYVG